MKSQGLQSRLWIARAAVLFSAALLIQACASMRDMGAMPPPPPPTVHATIVMDGTTGCACAVKKGLPDPERLCDGSEIITISKSQGAVPVKWHSSNGGRFLFFDPFDPPAKRTSNLSGQLTLTLHGGTPVIPSGIPYKYTVVSLHPDGSPIGTCAPLDPKVIVQP